MLLLFRKVVKLDQYIMEPVAGLVNLVDNLE